MHTTAIAAMRGYCVYAGTLCTITKKNNLFLVIMEILKHLGPWMIATVSLIAFIVNYRYNKRKDEEKSLEINYLKKTVDAIKNQSQTINKLTKEAEISNDINMKSLKGLQFKIEELRKQTNEFSKSAESQKRVSDAKYLPELIISEFTYCIKGWRYNDYLLPLSYSLKESSFKEEIIPENLRLNLFNIGFAAAKKVEWSWEFDLDKAVEIFETVKSRSIYSVRSFSGIVVIESPPSKYEKTNFVNTQLRKKETTFILPESIEKSKVKIEIPTIYLDLYSIYLSSYFSHYNEIIETSNEKKKVEFIVEKHFPNLYVNLNYQDLEGILHKKKLQLKFDMYSITNLTKQLSDSKFNIPIATIGVKVSEEKNTVHNNG